MLDSRSNWDSRIRQVRIKIIDIYRSTCNVSFHALPIRAFRRFDNDGSGFLKMDEFSQGFRECGIDLTDEEISELFNHFDADNSGSIHYNEFLRAIRVSSFANIESIPIIFFSKAPFEPA